MSLTHTHISVHWRSAFPLCEGSDNHRSSRTRSQTCTESLDVKKEKNSIEKDGNSEYTSISWSNIEAVDSCIQFPGSPFFCIYGRRSNLGPVSTCLSLWVPFFSLLWRKTCLLQPRQPASLRAKGHKTGLRPTSLLNKHVTRSSSSSVHFLCNFISSFLFASCSVHCALSS